MTGAMYAAIAGLRTHMQNLNVIGNNVANVNTQSYKSARSVFKTAIYTTLSGGSDGTQVVGGANPSQIGYGSNMSSVGIDMSTGNYSVTGNSTDMMLDGDGFFLMGNKDVADTFTGGDGDVSKLTSLTLTRLGNFGFKADGYLTNDDLCVYGFMCIGVWGDDAHPMEIAGEGENAGTVPNPDAVGKKAGDPIFSDQLVPIRFPGVRMTERYYDKEGVELTGTALTAAIAMKPEDRAAAGITVQEVGEIMYATTGESSVGKLQDAYYYVDPATGKEVTATGENGTLPAGAVKTTYPKAQFTGITVDQKTGLITGTSNETNEVVTIGCVAVGQVTNPNGVTQIGNSYYKASAGSGDLTISVLGGGASELGISYVNGELTRARYQPAAGDDDNTNADDEAAAVEVTYADGMRIRNGGKTSLLSNGLEMSKTDLAQEISNMILTQRGYQANTRIITVTDSMLEELVNMKR